LSTLLAFFFSIALSQSVTAQTSISAESSIRIYKTQSVLKDLKVNHPEILDSLRLVERHIYQYRPIGTNEEITIPVVFHILHNSSNPSELVAKQAIEAQLVALNRDFQGANPTQSNFTALKEGFDNQSANDTGIRFCMAENGINYVSTTVSSWRDDGIKLAEGAAAWNPKKYLNIWIGNLDGFGGYAYLPGMAYDVNLDGVVLDYRYVDGSLPKFSLHRTGTHLVLGFLGLRELWDENQPCSDDGVFDTPIHNSPNYGTTNSYRHVSTCYNNEVEMTMNLMDGGVDEQVYLLTKGQKKRLRAVLSEGGFRHGLTQTPTLCGTSNFTSPPNVALQNRSSKTNEVLIKVLPNPTKGNFQIALSGESNKIQVNIFDAQGRQLFESNSFSLVGTHNLSIDGSRWLSGMYFIKVQTDKALLNSTFIINK